MFNGIKSFLRRHAKNIARKRIYPAVLRRVWKRIKAERGKDTLIFIPGCGMGDTLYCMAYLGEIKRRYPEKKIVVVSFERRRFLVETFNSYDQVVFVPDHGRRWLELMSLAGNIDCSDKLFRDGIIVSPFGFTAMNPDFYKQRLDLLGGARRVFRLDPAARPEYHHLTSTPPPGSFARELADRGDHIVILNPYSKSMRLDDVAAAFFERVCALLRESGYSVYTNVVRDQKPVRGSLPLKCSMAEMVYVAERVPLVVSVRSGFLDVLAPTRINMFVLYNVPWRIVWYTLKGWPRDAATREVFYFPDDLAVTDKLVAAFREFLSDITPFREEKSIEQG